MLEFGDLPIRFSEYFLLPHEDTQDVPAFFALAKVCDLPLVQNDGVIGEIQETSCFDVVHWILSPAH